MFVAPFLLKYSGAFVSRAGSQCLQIQLQRWPGRAFGFHVSAMPGDNVAQNPAFRRLFTEPLKQLIAVFDRHHHEIRFAGGVVRDLLDGKVPHDVDLATTATPGEMRHMFNAENIRMFNEQGEKHGTVSVRIMDEQNFEITTLRIDRVTDGRHATVEFTRDWRVDAERRDLTVNSMFLGLDGTVYDFFGGREDLKRRRVAFVGDADRRIKEDYLRILRYFRFFGRLAGEGGQHEEATLRAISQNAEGMARISGERIWAEWKQILGGPMAAPLTATMIRVGLARYIGLPDYADVDNMLRLWSQNRHLSLHPVTVLTSLLKDDDDMMRLNARLRLSVLERELGRFVIAHRGERPLSLAQCKAIIAETKHKKADCRIWLQESLKYHGQVDTMSQLAEWQLPEFPVSGGDLKQMGLATGKLLGHLLDQLRLKWIESDFTMTQQQLLDQVPDLLRQATSRSPPQQPKRQKLT